MEALKERWASWRRRTPRLVVAINVAGWLLVLGLCIASTLSDVALPVLKDAQGPSNLTPSEVEIVYTDLGEGSNRGITISITRLAFARRQDMLDRRVTPIVAAQEGGLDYFNRVYAADVQAMWSPYEVMGEIELEVSNHSPVVATMFFSRGKLAVNAEQVSLTDLPGDSSLYTYGYNLVVDSEILPGSTAKGGIWFGLRQTTLKELRSLNRVSLWVPLHNEYGSGDVLVRLDLRG